MPATAPVPAAQFAALLLAAEKYVAGHPVADALRSAISELSLPMPPFLAADAAKPGASETVQQHVHMHGHPGGVRHVHEHTHAMGVDSHAGEETEAPHRHGHFDPKPGPASAPTAIKLAPAPALDVGRPSVALASEPEIIALARQYQQKIFNETGQAPDSILPGRKSERDRVVNTLGAALKVVSATTPVHATKTNGQSDSERVMELARAFQIRRYSECGIRPGAAGNERAQALKAISEGRDTARFGDAATIPNNTVQQTLPGREDASSFTTPQQPDLAWDRKAGWRPKARPADQVKARLLGKPLQDSAYGVEVSGYAETKRQHSLGRPATAHPNHQEARAAAVRLGEQLKASEPAPHVVNDNQDVVQAAEAWITQRFRDRGEKVSFKDALKHVSQRRR
jgi:hypothetical protein